MDKHARLWGEFASLLRGLKDLNAHVLETAGVRCEIAGAAVLGRLELLGPVRLTSLAESLGLDPSSVSRQVSALERAGWVAREKDPHDLRAQQLHLTDAGQAVVAEIRRARADALKRLTPGWSPADIDDLTDRLARLNTDLAANRHLLDARQESA
ncbi:MAG: MarR family transcriptional regulator [Mycobacteriales bacterium]